MLFFCRLGHSALVSKFCRMSSSAPVRLGLVAFLFSFTWRKNIEPLNTFTLWFRSQPFLLPCVLSFCEEPHCCSVTLDAGLGCTLCSREVSGGVPTHALLGMPSCVCALVIIKHGLKFLYVTWAYSVVSPPFHSTGESGSAHTLGTYVNLCIKQVSSNCLSWPAACRSISGGRGGHVILVVAHANFAVHWGLASPDPSRGENFNHSLQTHQPW